MVQRAHYTPPHHRAFCSFEVHLNIAQKNQKVGGGGCSRPAVKGILSIQSEGDIFTTCSLTRSPVISIFFFLVPVPYYVDVDAYDCILAAADVSSVLPWARRDGGCLVLLLLRRREGAGRKFVEKQTRARFAGDFSTLLLEENKVRPTPITGTISTACSIFFFFFFNKHRPPSLLCLSNATVGL